jgi:hypothetical protein
MALFTTVLTLTATLAAAPAPDSESPDADERARVGTTNAYVYIDGESLEGEVLTADGALIQTRIGKQRESLIKLRRTFLDHLYVLSRDI